MLCAHYRMASTRAWMLWDLIQCRTRQQEWVRVAHARPGHPTVYQGARCVHYRAIYPLFIDLTMTV